MAHIRQLRPDSGLGSQAKDVITFYVVPFYHLCGFRTGYCREAGPNRVFRASRFVPQVAGFRRAPVQIKAIETDDLVTEQVIVGNMAALIGKLDIRKQDFKETKSSFFCLLICTTGHRFLASSSANEGD